MVKTKLTAILRKKMSKTTTATKTPEELFYFGPNDVLYRLPANAAKAQAVAFKKQDGREVLALDFTKVNAYVFPLKGKDDKPFTKVVADDEIISTIEGGVGKYYASPKDENKLFRIPDKADYVSVVRVTLRDGKQFYAFDFEMKEVYTFTLPGKDGNTFMKLVPVDEVYTIKKA